MRMKWMVLSLCLAGVVLAEDKRAPDTKKKVKKAPAFTLPNLDGKKIALKDFENKIVVLEWTNHLCPFVVKHYKSKNMQALQKKYKKKGIVWLSICSSAPGKQGDMNVEKWKQMNKAYGAEPTAVLLDPEGKVGRLYKAKTTPHMYIIDKNGIIRYEGAIDDKRSTNPEHVKTSKNYVGTALDALLAGKEIPVTKSKPYGCSVKYAKPKPARQ